MTTERKNINLTLSVPVETRKNLRQLAVDREQTLSEIVIELINDTAATAKNQQTIKITFSAEELRNLEEVLLHREIEQGAIADYCKKVVMAAVQKELDDATTKNNS